MSFRPDLGDREVGFAGDNDLCDRCFHVRTAHEPHGSACFGCPDRNPCREFVLFEGPVVLVPQDYYYQSQS